MESREARPNGRASPSGRHDEDLLNPDISAGRFTGETPGLLPRTADVVIIGGGIAGCSLAYHLTKHGLRRVVVLEMGTVASGTTWHAAGLIVKGRGSHVMTELASYGVDLYARLEEETGVPAGFNQCGSLTLASHGGRLDELRYLAGIARHHGIPAQMLSPDEAARFWPLAALSGVVGALLQPLDGMLNPGWAALALAKGAHDGGASIHERVSVRRIRVSRSRVTAVETDQGLVETETVALAAGLWSRDLAGTAGVSIPLYAAEHEHVSSGPIHGAHPGLPVLRDLDQHFYARHYRGGLLIGAFEPDGRPRSTASIQSLSGHVEFEPDWTHFAPTRRNAEARIPSLKEAGFQRFLCAPESFTPDANFLLGETPEISGLFVVAGFNSQGIIFSPGAGRALADWIVEGVPGFDSSAVDCGRFARTQSNGRYLHERTREGLGRLYAMHWPHLQPATARDVRRSPLHERLARAGACFGELNSWERANWFAPTGVVPQYEYAYGRQNWFSYVGEEHRAAREKTALFDLSSYTKLLVAGESALDLLQLACTQDVEVPIGRLVYTLMCNSRGGIEFDATVTRIAEARYLVVAPTVTQHRIGHWLRRLAGDGMGVEIVDMTSGLAVLAVMGPGSRSLLNSVSSADLSDEAFPWGHAREIDVAEAECLAMRVSFVGEMGWELYVPVEYAVHVYDALWAASQNDLRHAGYHALDSLRTEKGYRHLGHDVGPADDPYQAGLGFAVKLSKRESFVGRAALEQAVGRQPSRRQVFVRLVDGRRDMLGAESILVDGNVVGHLTSASFGYTVGAACGLGFVDAEAVSSTDAEIALITGSEPAVISQRPFYDPQGARLGRVATVESGVV
jgi:heterotetrameric sarcosine oxidase gamma subunit